MKSCRRFAIGGAAIALAITSATAHAADSPIAMLEVGTGTMDTNPCTAASQKRYVVAFDQTPTVSAAALQTSFNALVAAFVLAVALENAFALLFNWRLFQALLVGKAWRTPIMFVAALAVVRNFRFDLMATLFDVVYGVDGRATSLAAARVYRFGPRAIVNFSITIP